MPKLKLLVSDEGNLSRVCGVELDGRLLKGVRSVSFTVDGGRKMPTVHVEFVGTDIEIEKDLPVMVSALQDNKPVMSGVADFNLEVSDE